MVEEIKQNINLLDTVESDLNQQENLHHSIANLNEQLEQFKTNLNNLDTKLEQKVNEIVESQGQLIKLRIKFENYGNMCEKVGNLTYGTAYE